MGLSQRELSNGSLLPHRLPAFPLHSKAQGLSPPVPLWGDTDAAAHGYDPRVCARPSFLSHMPCSDSWHRIGWNFACAYIHTYQRVASGRPLCSPLPALSSAGVTISRPYLSPWTIPGLPGSHTRLLHRVARKHLGTTGWSPSAFASIVQARPFPVFGRPVHPWDSSL